MEPLPASPPRRPDGGKSGTVFALVLALLLPAGIAAQVSSPLAGLFWTEPFVFLVPAVIAAAGSNLEPRAWLRLRPAGPTALGCGALVGAAGWFLGSALFATVQAAAPARWVERFDLSRLFQGSFAEQVAIAVAAGVVAPLCEEVAFRGHLASSFHSRHRPAVAIGATALVFALLHLDPLRGPSLLLLGALYGWLAWRTGSIWPAVAAHAVNNGVASILALSVGLPAGAVERPTLAEGAAGMAVGAAAVAAATGVFRHLVPATPAPPDVPLADPSDPSTRFRLARVPRQLVAAALAGWIALGAIVLSAR